MRSQAQVLIEVLADVEQETREIADVGRGLREDQERRTVRLVDACKQRLEDDVVRLVGQRRGWHQNVTDFGPQVSEEWDKEQEALTDELDEVLTARLTNLSHALHEAAVAAEREWTTAVRPDHKIEGLRDFRGLWKRRAAGAVVGGGGAFASMAIGAYVGSLAGPAGTVVMGLGSTLVTPLRKKVQSLFTSKAKILEANRELLRTEIGKILSELENQTLAEVAGTVARVREELARAFARRAKTEVDARWPWPIYWLSSSGLSSPRSLLSTTTRSAAFCARKADPDWPRPLRRRLGFPGSASRSKCPPKPW